MKICHARFAPACVQHVSSMFTDCAPFRLYMLPSACEPPPAQSAFTMPDLNPLHPGIYQLLNAHSGKALSVDPSNKIDVIGLPLDGRDYQRWEFVPAAGGFLVRSMASARDGTPLYLNLKLLHDGEPLKTGLQPMVWSAVFCREDSFDGWIRLSFASRFHADWDCIGKHKVWPSSLDIEQLTCGNLIQVQLIHYKDKELCQLWYPHRCDLIPTSIINSADQERSDRHNSGGSPSRDVTVDLGQQNTPGAGVHLLQNLKSGTVLHLARRDRRRLECYPLHAELNQQWEFISIGEGYAIKCGRTAFDGQPLYLTVEAPAHDSSAIVASLYPVPWKIERCMTRASYRIYWPGTDLAIELANNESMDGGIHVHLAPFSPDGRQLWRALLL
ncbi:hypothetical protein BD414DRAFT_500232 [Trametes punicea]|nr:hypothetical protein BD414DRAFT_500232 [Trametes punicea]